MTTPARSVGRPPRVTTLSGRTVQGAPPHLHHPPAGLEETARQWLCENFTKGTGHDGKPDKMLIGFKTALRKGGGVEACPCARLCVRVHVCVRVVLL